MEVHAGTAGEGQQAANAPADESLGHPQPVPTQSAPPSLRTERSGTVSQYKSGKLRGVDGPQVGGRRRNRAEERGALHCQRAQPEHANCPLRPARRRGSREQLAGHGWHAGRALWRSRKLDGRGRGQAVGGAHAPQAERCAVGGVSAGARHQEPRTRRRGGQVGGGQGGGGALCVIAQQVKDVLPHPGRAAGDEKAGRGGGGRREACVGPPMGTQRVCGRGPRWLGGGCSWEAVCRHLRMRPTRRPA